MIKGPVCADLAAFLRPGAGSAGVAFASLCYPSLSPHCSTRRLAHLIFLSYLPPVTLRSTRTSVVEYGTTCFPTNM